MRADARPKDPAFERQPLHTADWEASAASMAAALAPGRIGRASMGIGGDPGACGFLIKAFRRRKAASPPSPAAPAPFKHI
jgi:hypothetical protein